MPVEPVAGFLDPEHDGVAGVDGVRRTDPSDRGFRSVLEKARTHRVSLLMVDAQSIARGEGVASSCERPAALRNSSGAGRCKSTGVLHLRVKSVVKSA